MKIKRFIAALIVLVSVLTLFACNKAGGNYSDANAYVSVYAYGKDGKIKISADAVRVAPQEAPENTTGTLSDEDAKQMYRTKPTGLYALEQAVIAKDKNATLPTVLVSQYNGEIEYTLDTVSGSSAGRSGYDIFVWEFTINGEKADYAKSTLKNYDKLEFRLVEQTNRTFNQTFTVTKGNEVIVDEEEFGVIGEKSEMTIANFLKGKYEDQDNEELVLSALGITLSEDGSRVVKIGDLEENETTGERWVCLIHQFDDDFENDEEIEGDLNSAMIDEYSIIRFDYRQITEASGQETEEIAE